MKARYVELIGAYHDLEHAQWRASVATPLDTPTENNC
jgi:hypothetical protein